MPEEEPISHLMVEHFEEKIQLEAFDEVRQIEQPDAFEEKI